MGNCKSKADEAVSTSNAGNATNISTDKPPSRLTTSSNDKDAKTLSAAPHTNGKRQRQGYQIPNFKVKVKTSTIPTSIEDDDFAIPIKIYEPCGEDAEMSSGRPEQPLERPEQSETADQPVIRAAVFLIHGGIFSKGDRDSHSTIAHALASSLELVVVTASFRNGKDAPHKTNITMRDLEDVIDFVRSEYCNIGSEGCVPFGLVGSSSGGFFALTLCQSLGSKIIDFCIPICPVADPFKRASYLRSSISGSAISDGYTSDPHDPSRSQHILEHQLSFWENDDSMMKAGESLKVDKSNVPTLLILGSADKNVPFAVTADVQAWATRTVVIGGRGHELCDDLREEDGWDGYQSYLPDIDRFLDYCLTSKEGS